MHCLCFKVHKFFVFRRSNENTQKQLKCFSNTERKPLLTSSGTYDVHKQQKDTPTDFVKINLNCLKMLLKFTSITDLELI